MCVCEFVCVCVCVQKGMTDWRTQNIWSDGEQGRIQDMQEDTQKETMKQGALHRQAS